MPILEKTFSPSDLLTIYNNGFQGTVVDEAAKKAIYGVAQTFYTAFPGSKGIGKGKLSLPFKFALALDPEFGVYEAQTTGDCQNGSVHVKMANGSWKRIKDITIGENVFSAFGTSRKVLDTIKKPYTKSMVRLKLSDHDITVDATPDHNIWTENGWKAISQLTKEDKVAIPNTIDNGKLIDKVYDISEYAHTTKRFIKMDKRLAWLIGIYAAEGCIDGSYSDCERITFNLGHRDIDHANKINQYCQELFGIEAEIYQVPSKPTVLYVRVNSTLVANFMKHLCGGNIYDKFLHNDLLYITEHNKLALLQGWLDGDGHYGRCMSGATVSKELAIQLFEISINLGLDTSIRIVPEHTDKNGVLHVEAYIVSYAKASHTQLLSLEPLKLDNRFGIFKQVESITEVDREEDFVYCLMVKEDHSFIANGIGVSNCVSHSTRNAGMMDYCADAAWGQTKFKGRLATENIYGWRGHGGQGASCDRLALYVSQDGPGGYLPRAVYKSADGRNSVDLSTYRSSIGHNWGGSGGPPKWLNDIAAQNKALRVMDVNSVEEARDALAVGFGISMCSGYGFSSSRNADGLAERQGGWSHAMAWIACDDTDWAYKTYGGPLFLIQNSWGDWNGGPRRNDQPEGSFWIRPSIAKAMIDGGGGWVIASVRGYERELVLDRAGIIEEISYA